MDERSKNGEYSSEEVSIREAVDRYPADVPLPVRDVRTVFKLLDIERRDLGLAVERTVQARAETVQLRAEAERQRSVVAAAKAVHEAVFTGERDDCPICTMDPSDEGRLEHEKDCVFGNLAKALKQL